jgi:hypothetical protein
LAPTLITWNKPASSSSSSSSVMKVDAMTQIELSCEDQSCWEVEPNWKAPGDGAAAANQMPLLIQCLELLSFSLYSSLQDYPKTFLPLPEPHAPSSLGYTSWLVHASDVSWPLTDSDLFAPQNGHLALSAVRSHNSSHATAWKYLRRQKISEALALVELVCSISISPTPLPTSSINFSFPVLEVRKNKEEENEYSDDSVMPKFEVGDALEAQWNQGSLFYPGTVSAVHEGVVGDGTRCYDVSYDDGEFEKEVPFTLVRSPVPLAQCLSERPWGVVR